MPTTYGQFCPVAKAMELLDERWTMLVVRELMMGSRHFNELRRGVPKMSPSLLSKRLRTLQRAGVVDRWEHGNRVTYQLSRAGRELEPIVVAIGQWGTRWIGDLGDQDLDPNLLMWDVHRNLDLDAMSPGRTVLHFTFAEVEPVARNWWIVVHDREVDVCDDDPGFDVDVTVSSSLRGLTEVWRGDVAWSDALRAGQVELVGPADLCAKFPEWLLLSALASTPRPGHDPVEVGASA